MNDDLTDHGLGDLGAQLDAAASSVHAEPDIGEVRQRAGRQRRVRGTAMAAVAALAVVASVAAWRSGDQPVSVASSADPSTTQPSGDATASSGAGGANTRTTGEGLSVSVARTDGAFVPSTPWWTPPESCRGPQQPVVSVTDPTKGGKGASTTMFVTLGQTEEEVTVDASLVYVGAPLQVETSEAGDLTTSTLRGVTVEPHGDGTAIITGGTVDPLTSLSGGVTDDLPEPDAWVVTLAVSGDDVRHVKVTFVNGTVDEADAVDGLVGLAARYPDGPTDLAAGLVSRVEVTQDHGDPIVLTELNSSHAGFDAAGASLGSTSVTPVTTEPVSAECTAPPAPLPAPGEPPADTAAAQAAVTSAVATFMDGSKPEAEHEAAMQDPAHGQRVQQELGAGYAAAMTSARATVKDVVFVSPTTAIVRYDLDVTPTGAEPLPIPTDMFHDSIARVVLVDGRWVVTPQSLCTITSVATPIACTGMTSADPDEVYGPGGSAT